MHIIHFRSLGQYFSALTALVLLSMTGVTHAAEVLPSARFAVVFGTPNCHECQALKDWWTASAQTTTAGVKLVIVDAEKPRNFEWLGQLEKACGVTAGDDPFPAIYIPPKTLIYDYKKFVPLLPKLLEDARRCPEPSARLAEIARAAAANDDMIVAYDVPEKAMSKPVAATPATPRQLAYFFLPRCEHCSRMNAGLQYLKKTTPGLRISRYDITTEDGQAVFECVREHFGISGHARISVPMVVWETGWHCSRPPEETPWATVKRWFGAGEPKPEPTPPLPAGLTAKLAPSDTLPFWDCFSAADKRTALARTRTFLDQLDWGGIALAGLIDGINPCAFATTIFLVGYLIYLGRGRKAIFLLGGSFCFGVFATYFLLGLGLSKLADWINSLAWLKTAVYGMMGTGGLVLAVMHVRDAWCFHRTGLARDMSLGLSAETTRKIHAHVREYSGRKSLVLAGLVLGVIISSLELVCTGQIYLPALMVMNRRGMTGHSLLLLLVYNLAFILPLVLVTLLAAGGVSGKRLAEFARRNVTLTKLLMAALFLLLAAAMLFLAIKG